MNQPTNLEVCPFFQPIVSLETQRVVGFESLGRNITKNGVQSLGPFFQSSTVTEDEKLNMDVKLWELAVDRFKAALPSQKLFINLKPSMTYQYIHRPEAFPLHRILNRSKLAPSQIVIEVVEESFEGNTVSLTEFVNLYRKQGCQIAIDDLGSGFSNFDRVVALQPEIIKVDLNIIRKSQTDKGYLRLLRSFASLADHVGASLLLEGIESEDDVYKALSVGARYLQGYYFSAAAPNLIPDSYFSTQLRALIDIYAAKTYDEEVNLLDIQHALTETAEQYRKSLDMRRVNDFLFQIGQHIHPSCFRMYICRSNGDQISSNLTRHATGEWVTETNHAGSNWIWRPYFLANILTMKHHEIGTWSPTYRDLHTSLETRTYSYRLTDELHIFLDIDTSYTKSAVTSP